MLEEMLGAYREYWERYTDFSGRTSRAKYWWVFLVNFIIGFFFGLLGAIGVSLSGIYSLVTIIPGIAIAVRRLHDINKSGWNLLWAFLPLVGWIIVLVYLVSESKYN